MSAAIYKELSKASFTYVIKLSDIGKVKTYKKI